MRRLPTSYFWYSRIRADAVQLIIFGVVAFTLATFSDAFVPSTTTARTISSNLCATDPIANSSNDYKSGRSTMKPAFAQAAHQVSSGGGGSTSTNTRTINPAVIRSSKPTRRFNSDSSLGSLHEQRIKTAGRVGTKRYVNPCKVFVGNLPFSATSDDLQQWICEQLGMPSGVLVHECKIISDWKTGKSKGYGFVVFTEAIYATVCIDKSNGQMWDDRIVTVNQGVKKEQEQQLWLKKKKSKPVDQEEEAISAALEEAEEYMDPEEVAVLRMLDPDLLPDSLKSNAKNDYSSSSVPLVNENGEPMNRQKRRETERKLRKLKKPTNKGFG